MTAALRYEWVRIRSIRSSWWISVIAIGFAAGVAFLAAWATSNSFGGSDAPTEADLPFIASGLMVQLANFGGPYFVAYILAMIPILAWGHEYRHGMIRATLTALPSRTHVWVAKTLVATAWVVVVNVIALGSSVAMSWLWLRDDGLDFGFDSLGGLFVRALGYTVIFTLLAGAFTAVIRNQTAALVLLFLWPLAIENVIELVFNLIPGLRDNAEVTRFLPFDAGGAMLNDLTEATSTFGTPLSPVGGALVFGTLTVLALVASFVLFERRDA